MFKPNKSHLQKELFHIGHQLGSKTRQGLEESWAKVFYEEVFSRMDESIFSVLYAKGASRPNVPVNQLVAFELFKLHTGMSDRMLYQDMCFGIHYRWAIGLRQIHEDIFDIRSIYHFRRRVVNHMYETGENLFEKVMSQVTDEQLKRFAIKTDWQRFDSTQLFSNVAMFKRMELLISVVQNIYKRLSEEKRAEFTEEIAPFLGSRPHEIYYKMDRRKEQKYMVRIGKFLQKVASGNHDDDVLQLARRVLEEQFEQQAGEEISPVANKDVPASSLQSVYDKEATFRNKHEKVKGFVGGVSETCAPENKFQIITHVCVASNTADDGELLATSLRSQQERSIEVKEATVDGGYTGKVATAICEALNVSLHPTKIRGRQCKPGTLTWDQYQWQMDGSNKALSVSCPGGQQATLLLSKSSKMIRYHAQFDKKQCRGCVFLGKGCRVIERRECASFYVNHRSIIVAIMRQNMREIDRKVRAIVEASMRSIKLGLEGSKLPIRGLIRSSMFMNASAMIVNMHRIHKYRRTQLQLARNGT